MVLFYTFVAIIGISSALNLFNKNAKNSPLFVVTSIVSLVGAILVGTTELIPKLGFLYWLLSIYTFNLILMEQVVARIAVALWAAIAIYFIHVV